MVNDTPGQIVDHGYVDWLQLSYQRTYQVDDDWLIFGGDIAGSNRYQLDGFTSSDIELFDITDLNQVRQITGASISNLGGGKYRLQFGANETDQRRYLALTTAQRQHTLLKSLQIRLRTCRPQATALITSLCLITISWMPYNPWSHSEPTRVCESLLLMYRMPMMNLDMA